MGTLNIRFRITLRTKKDVHTSDTTAHESGRLRCLHFIWQAIGEERESKRERERARKREREREGGREREREKVRKRERERERERGKGERAIDRQIGS